MKTTTPKRSDIKKYNMLILCTLYLILNTFSSYSQHWKWVKQPIGSGSNSYDIITDVSGNSYVTGTISNSNSNYSSATVVFGTYTLTVSNVDMFLAKYDSEGNVLWARQAISHWANGGYGVSLDSSG